ncbi:MAG: hypothetical protein FWE74_09375 [Oscillospiraceae bacterium]|nr:hypothetical protein [Oscillospiraceae bacterium]
MKSFKKTIAVIIVSALLLTLYGCKKTGEDSALKEINPEISKTDESSLNISQSIETQEFSADEPPSEQHYETSFSLETIVIRSADRGDLKSELIKEINDASGLRSDESLFLHYNISDIKEFYYPEIELDGYELFLAEIMQYRFHFYFMPENPDSADLDLNGEYFFSYDSGIEIAITRTETIIDTPDPLKAIMEQYDGQRREYLFEDGLIYDEFFNTITGQIGDTWFYIVVPPKLNNYEFMRRLALQVIEAAELVVIRE